MAKFLLNEPLVSVIIPNYNYSRYLEQRLFSVLNQTYQYFEVIILDDHSTDNSLDIIDKYKGNPHISTIVVNEVNSGSPFLQWEKGIALSRGEIIWIAESDDYCELSFLEELINVWKTVPNACAAHVGYVTVDNEGNVISKAKERSTMVIDGKHYVRTRMVRSCLFKNASGAIFRKENVMCISKQYQSLKSAGDYLFWTEICSSGNVIEVHKNLTYFRVHPSSVTNKNFKQGVIALENKIVYDYINSSIGLTKWQKFMALSTHYSGFSKGQYESDSVKERIMFTWNFGKLYKCTIISKYLQWFVGTIERHLGIFI